MQKKPVRSRPLPLMEELEPRVLFSAGLDVVLIDSSLDDAQLLREASQLSEAVVLYDSTRDSAAELLSRAAELADARGERIETLSILSHGSEGSFQLGTDTISLDSLALSADAWKSVAESMVEGGNIYLFGCNVGAGSGEALLDQLAELTGRDVFASDDLSGAGGDWQLEAASRGAEAELRSGVNAPLSTEVLAQYTSSLAQPVLNDQSLGIIPENLDNETLVGTVQTTPVWAFTDWQHRKAITVDHTKVAADQTEFPLWIDFASDAQLAAGAQLDGDDILFTDAAGNKLAHEIETYVGSSGKLQAWVRVPLLSASADTKIYMYYGNAAATNQQNVAGVWDANYTGVWHLDEGAADNTVYQDATAGNHDATMDSQGYSVETAGRIGDAVELKTHTLLHLSSHTEVITTAAMTGVNMTQGTMQAWVQVTDNNDDSSVLIFGKDQNNYVSIYLGDGGLLVPGLGLLDSGDLSYEMVVNGVRRTGLHVNTNLRDGNWHHIAATWTSTGARLSVDGGAFVDLESGDERLTFSGSGRAQIGSGVDSFITPLLLGEDGYHGKMDEVRYSNVARSASWLTTEYRNQSSPNTFETRGGAETYNLSYSIVGGNTGSAFKIEASTGRILVNDKNALNYESIQKFQLTVKVADGGLSDTAVVTIDLADLNEWTPVLGDQTFAVSESAASGTDIGTLNATDGDTLQTFTYSIIGGNSAGVFSINASTGQILVANAAPLDAVTTPQYVLTVQVMDSVNTKRTDTAQITIDVTPNNAPVVANQSFALAENTNNGTPVGTVVAADPDAGAGWASTSWNFRKQLVTDHTQVSATLTDFPLLVSFPADAALAAGARSDGRDIFFTAADGVTKLAHQIERYNPITGELVAWVKLPQLSATADTRVYMYYGNATAPAQANPTAVWDTDYAAVWHLNETVGTPADSSTTTDFYKDSSGNGVHLTLTDVPGAVVPTTGAQGTALDMGGVNDQLDSNWGPLALSEGTLELWVKHNGLSKPAVLLSRYTDIQNQATLEFDATGKLMYKSTDGGVTVSQVVANTTLADGQWHHVSVTWSATGAQIRVDYDAVTASISGNETLSWGSSLARMRIGADVQTGGINYRGAIDEIRISGIARSDAWLEAQYQNQSASASFLTTSAQQNQGGAGQQLTYSITSGNVGNAFAINATTGVITVNNKGALDYEANPQIVLTVSVRDDGSPALSDTAQITINLSDVNDAAPVASDATFAAAENSPNGVLVGIVSATDVDTAQTRTFSITAGNVGGAFAIDASTGAITVADGSQIDMEVRSQYTLTVLVRDSGSPQLSDTATITINVAPENEFAPSFSGATFALSENAASGSAVGSVSASDSDTPLQILTYAITAGDPGGIFAIDPATGLITVADASTLDYEAVAQYALTVTVTDDALLPRSTSATVTVNITDFNEWAPVVTAATLDVAEGTPSGTVLGSVSADDDDSSQTRSFAITAGDPTGIFAIDSATGVISLADGSQLDYEARASYSLTVTVTDSGTPQKSGSATVTVNVSDFNESAPVVTPATFSISEAAGNGAALGTVSADDAADAQTLTYAITAGDPTGIFAIDPATGAITVADASQLDHESAPQYALTVTVTDSGTPQKSGSATITVNVTDFNESAPVVTPATFSVSEAAGNGAALGTVSAVDAADAQTLTYAISAGDPTGIFAIDPATGAITVADASQLDHESAPQYSFTVTVTDSGTPQQSGSATITVNVTDFNEWAPVVTAATFSISEAAGNGAALGTVDADDADSSQTLTYAISAGDPTGIFAIDPATGAITVADASQLDHENAPQYSLTVTVTDSLAPQRSGSATITVNVTDFNEWAPVVTAATFSVSEAAGNGAALGTVDADDADSSQTLTYAITAGDPTGIFAIDPATGAITVADASQLDHEGTPQYSLTVTVTDSLAPQQSGSATLTINVTDFNESAPVVTAATFSVSEAAGNGTALGTVDADDADSSQTLTYAISAGDPTGIFAIDPATGAITVADASQLDHEDTPQYSLTVTVTDSLAPQQSGSAIITVDVTDFNEWAPVVTAATFSVSEAAGDGTALGTVDAVDADSSQTLTYAISAGDPTGIFAIDPATGAITVADSSQLDHENTPQYSLTITVTDSLAPQLSGSATITVNVTDFNEWAPVVTAATFSVSEAAGNGTALGTVDADDADSSQTLTYAITAGDPTGIFAIDPATGAITVADASQLDHESAPQYSLTITVTDSLAPQLSGSATITVDVTDFNEWTPVVSAASFSVSEAAGNGTALGTVAAVDADTSQTLTYAISAGDPTGIFAIDPATGAITVADASQLDHETAPQFSLTVTVTDSLAPQRSGSATITVDVTDFNEWAPVVSAATFSVSEAAASGTALGTVAAADADTSQTLTYAISAGDPTGIFAIDPATGAITVADASQLDHENAPQYSLTITVTDSLAPQLSGSATLTVNVTDFNEWTPVALDASFALLEDAAVGTAIGTVSASDADTSQTLSYAITGGNAQGLFAIDAATGQISVARGLDHESRAEHTLTITVSDDLGPVRRTRATVTIAVGDVNEFDPTVRGAAFSVATSAGSGERIGRISASDADTSQKLSYAITGGDPGGLFLINSASGEIFLADPSLLGAAGGAFTLTVTVTDDAAPGRSGSALVTVQVVSETPTIVPEDPTLPAATEPEPVVAAPETPTAPAEAHESVAAEIEEPARPSTRAHLAPPTPGAGEEASPRIRGLSESSSKYRTRAVQIPAELLQVPPSQLEQVHRDMEGTSELYYATAQFSAATLLISAGALSWLIRSGSLVSSLMMSLPAWLRFDPLMVLSDSDREDEGMLDADTEFQSWLEGTELEDVFERESDEAEDDSAPLPDSH